MKINNLYFIVILLLFLYCNKAMAINKVTIATIGNIPASQLNHSNPDKLVDIVIQFWDNRLKQVLPDKPDLILLPEMCDRSQLLKLDERDIYFKARGNRILDFFSDVAKKNNCYIVFNTRLDVDTSYYNTTYVINRKGELQGKYFKNYPTIYEMESRVQPTDNVPTFDLDFGKVSIATCFDLNFDRLRVKHVEAKPSIILFPSMYHGGLVQNYWAYSANSYFVSSIGGRLSPSGIINPLGDVVASTTNYFDFAVSRINLDYVAVHLDYHFGKLRALKEKYKDKVIIHDPGKLAVVLVYSEHDTLSAKEMIKEFGIKEVSTYFEESIQLRHKMLQK